MSDAGGALAPWETSRMSTTNTILTVLGGLGMFLLGMGVLTDGLRSVAGSALRSVLARAARTPTRGAFWGGTVTLLVQSSSATTMTTIGLVSAGLLTFPQAVGVILGANVGTTGTGWIVALAGAKFSLNAAALPMVFVGALARVMGRGRWSGLGGALAGLGLILAGLTLLQEGMAGVAARVQPTDLPLIAGGGAWSAVRGSLQLVMAGAVMTTVMQSSSASVAATLTALQAGAIAPDQAAALVVGQNIGTSTSALIAAIGATTPARRTAVAHVLFNAVTAMVVLALFPLILPVLDDISARVDPTLLLAGFHTAYNLLGAAILLPLVGPFARMIERLVPQRGSVLTQHLDHSVLVVPAVAVEAARRTVAAVLAALCRSQKPGVPEEIEALHQTRAFLSSVSDPPASAAEAQRLTEVLHALDHTLRLADALQPERVPAPTSGWEAEAVIGADAVMHAEALSIEVRRECAALASQVAEGAGAADGAAAEERRARVERIGRQSGELASLRRTHRVKALRSVAEGGLASPSSPSALGAPGLPTSTEKSLALGAAVNRAIVTVDRVRWLDRVAHHSWRAAAHLVGGADGAAEQGLRSVE